MTKKRGVRKCRERNKMRSWLKDVVFIPFSLQDNRHAIAFCLYFLRRRFYDATFCSCCTRGQTSATQFRIFSHVFSHVCHDVQLLLRSTPVRTLRAIRLARYLNRESKTSSAPSHVAIIILVINTSSSVAFRGTPITLRKYAESRLPKTYKKSVTYLHCTVHLQNSADA